MGIVSGSKELYAMAEKGEEIEMCRALDEIKEEGRQKGLSEGKALGKAEGLAEGISFAKQVFILHMNGKTGEQIASELKVPIPDVDELLAGISGC